MYDLLNDALSQNGEKHQLGIFCFFPLSFLNTPVEKSGASRANFLPAETVGGTSLVAVVIHNSEIQTCDNGPCFIVLKLQSCSGFDRQI